MRIKDESIRSELVNGKHVITELGLVEAKPPKQEILNTYCGMPVDGEPTNQNIIPNDPWTSLTLCFSVLSPNMEHNSVVSSSDLIYHVWKFCPDSAHPVEPPDNIFRASRFLG